jgi:hypothetical protein
MQAFIGFDRCFIERYFDKRAKLSDFLQFKRLNCSVLAISMTIIVIHYNLSTCPSYWTVPFGFPNIIQVVLWATLCALQFPNHVIRNGVCWWRDVGPQNHQRDPTSLTLLMNCVLWQPNVKINSYNPLICTHKSTNDIYYASQKEVLLAS